MRSRTAEVLNHRDDGDETDAAAGDHGDATPP
jgi:hypothetical protein